MLYANFIKGENLQGTYRVNLTKKSIKVFGREALPTKAKVRKSGDKFYVTDESGRILKSGSAGSVFQWVLKICFDKSNPQPQKISALPRGSVVYHMHHDEKQQKYDQQARLSKHLEKFARDLHRVVKTKKTAAILKKAATLSKDREEKADTFFLNWNRAASVKNINKIMLKSISQLETTENGEG